MRRAADGRGRRLLLGEVLRTCVCGAFAQNNETWRLIESVTCIAELACLLSVEKYFNFNHLSISGLKSCLYSQQVQSTSYVLNREVVSINVNIKAPLLSSFETVSCLNVEK